MATTWIHPIYKTIGKSLSYCANDRIVNAVKAEIPDDVFYTDEHPEIPVGEVKLESWTDYLNVSAEDTKRVTQEFEKRIDRFSTEYGKGVHGKQRIAYHLIQSFDERIPVWLAHRIGVELADELVGVKRFQIQISTHTDTDNIHNHIIFSAWNNRGQKYVDNHETYRQIREASDRICEKYGVSVLADTKEQHLLKWTDSEGKTRFFEKTERKDKLRKERKEGKISQDDVGSYRNSESYKQYKKNQMTLREIVKRDIDEVLPRARSYEHLLELLKDRGYVVRDKKKNGEWMEHISFLAPGAQKAVRDSSLDNGIFYTRGNLTAYIEAYADVREMEAIDQAELLDKYGVLKPLAVDDTGFPLVSQLHDDVRVYTDFDRVAYAERKESERTVVQDLRKKQAELEQMVPDAAQRIKAIQGVSLQDSYKYLNAANTDRHVEYVIASIRMEYQLLCLLETMKDGDSEEFDQCIGMAQSRLDHVTGELERNRKQIEKMRELLDYPQRASEVIKRMNAHINDEGYLQIEYAHDKEILARYQKSIHSARLDSPGGVEKLTRKIAYFESQVDLMEKSESDARKRLEEYKCCSMLFKQLTVPVREAGHCERIQEQHKPHKRGRER